MPIPNNPRTITTGNMSKEIRTMLRSDECDTGCCDPLDQVGVLRNGYVDVVTIVLVLVMIVLGCSRPQKASRENTLEMKVSVDELSTQYKQNLTAARLKYSGHTVALTGRIKGRLNAARTLVFEHPEKGVAVQCFFKNEEIDSYNSSRDGNQYTYLGVVGTGSDDYLSISDCKMVK